MIYWVYYIIYALTFVVQSIFCVMCWRQRHTMTGYYLFLWMMGGCVWVLGILVCMPAAIPELVKDIMDALRMSVIAWVPVLTVLFALNYAGAVRVLRKPLYIVLSSIPICTQTLLLSPWTELFITPTRRPLSPEFVTVKFAQGPWFVVHSGWCILLALVAGALLVSQIFKNRGVLKTQAMLLFIGYVFPVVAMYLNAFPPGGFPLIDYTSFAFPVMSVCWYFALFRYKLLEVAPIAQARIVEVMQDAVVVLSPELTIVDINESARLLIGEAQDNEVLSQPLHIMWEGAPAALWELIERGEGRAQIALDDQVFDARYSLIKRARRHDPVGGVLVMRDITEQIALIKELDAYAHMVAHDLKNPLSAQRGYLEMIKEESEDVLDEDLSEDLVKVSQITEDMIGIVHELLVLASMRQKDAHIELVELDMGVIVDHVLVRQALQFASATILLPEQWCVARGHAPWIEEVWANFMSNAVKYGGDPPHIKLGCEPILARAMVRFWVDDNGDGLTEQEQARLFTDFSRLEQHSSIQGHGVGLSIVKRIVEHLGGEVGVESSPGEGSRFWFTLPTAARSRA